MKPNSILSDKNCVSVKSCDALFVPTSQGKWWKALHGVCLFIGGFST